MGRFTKDALITFITRVLTVILGLGVSIIIARFLGPKGQGIYSLAILLPSLLIIFTNFGIDSASIYFIGKKKYSPREVFGGNIIFTVLLSVSAILIGLIIIFFLSDRFFQGVEKIYLFLALSLIPFTLFFNFISHILLGLQKIKKYNIVFFLQSFFFLTLVGILLLGLRFGIEAVILAQVASYLLVGIILFFIIRKEAGGLIFKINKRYFKNILSYGFKVYLTNTFNFLHYRIDQFLINIFLNPIAVGFYYVAVRLSEAVWLLSSSVGTVLFPKIVSETDQKRLKEFTPLVCRNVVFVTLLIVILLLIFSHWIIVLFYSEEFLESIKPFQILLIGSLLIAEWRILANDLTARGKPIINTYITGFSVILNIILNIIFIPKWGIIGAAWATVISYSAVAVITTIIYSKISGNPIKNIIIFQKVDLNFYKNILSGIRKSRKLS